MRLASLPLSFAKVPTDAVHLVGEMSNTTRAAPEPVDACRYCTGFVLDALRGQS